MFDQLVTRKSIAELIALYDEQCAILRRGYAAVADAVAVLNVHFGEPFSAHEINLASALIKKVTEKVWFAILERLEVRKACTITEWERIEKQIKNNQMPELTIENAYDILRAYVANFDTMAQAALHEVCDLLTPGKTYVHGQMYKTNRPDRVARKVILCNCFDRAYIFAGQNTYEYKPHIPESRRTELMQIDRVFHALDGQGTMGGYYSPLVDALQSNYIGTQVETNYFIAKIHCNANLHLTLKREDLVDKLNQALSDDHSLGPKSAIHKASRRTTRPQTTP